MVFEMVSGRPPFHDGGAGAMIAAHIMTPPPALRAVAPDAPVEVEALVARLLARAPAERRRRAAERRRRARMRLWRRRRRRRGARRERGEAPAARRAESDLGVRGASRPSRSMPRRSADAGVGPPIEVTFGAGRDHRTRCARLADERITAAQR
ncbi:MAG: hypothetical protein HS111_33445 [Kofleriaceae bacterium]|nr:hypothetical protein [Kofleriaceae bacterium]